MSKAFSKKEWKELKIVWTDKTFGDVLALVARLTKFGYEKGKDYVLDYESNRIQFNTREAIEQYHQKRQSSLLVR
jgi:hypothetical protein